MSHVAVERFSNEHYLGLPADFNDRIIQKRIDLVMQMPSFCHNSLSIVDVGCGNGASLFALHQQFKSLKGIDIFKENEAIFNQIVNEKNLTNCSFDLIDIEKEKYQYTFDRLLCFEVIEHFVKENSVKKLAHLLKPNGLACITVPNKWWIFETHGAKLPFLPWNRVPFFSWLPTFIHSKWANARIYTKTHIINLLEANGFEVLDAYYITAPMDVVKNKTIKKFLLKYIFKNNTTNIPFLSTSIFVLAKPKNTI